MNRKLKEALGRNFTPPPSQKKDRFIQTINYPKASYTEVLLSQITFIRKRVWIGTIILLIIGFTATNYAQFPVTMISILSAMLPLFSLLSITEICKSASNNMAEMELSCKYNLSKITLMRLSILGGAGFIVLFVYVLLANGNDFGAFRNFIYLSMPYLISTNLSLVVISKFKSKETSYVCGGMSLGLSVSIIALNSSYQFIYSINYMIAWAISLILLLTFLVINVAKFKTSQEELQWNLV